MRKIPLMKARQPIAWAMVSDDVYEELSSYNWYLLVTKSEMRYAYRIEKIPDGRKLCVFMHRHILKLRRGDGKIVDHINRDSLDNQTDNLRICSREDNNFNRKMKAKKNGLPRGVRLSKNKRRYEAHGHIDGRDKVIKSFFTPSEAIYCRRKYEVEKYGFISPVANG